MPGTIGTYGEVELLLVAALLAVVVDPHGEGHDLAFLVEVRDVGQRRLLEKVSELLRDRDGHVFKLPAPTARVGKCAVHR